MNDIVEAKESSPSIEEKPIVLASRWSRLWAKIIDSIIVNSCVSALLWFGFTMLTEDLISYDEASVFTEGIKISGFVYLAGLNFIFLLAHGYLLATRGQTIGKYIFDIKIVSVKTNEMIGFLPLYLKRYLFLYAVSLIPFVSIILLIDVLFIFRKDKRCLHDLIAGTKVIDISKPEPEFDPSKY